MQMFTKTQARRRGAAAERAVKTSVRRRGRVNNKKTKKCPINSKTNTQSNHPDYPDMIIPKTECILKIFGCEKLADFFALDKYKII